MNEETTFEIGKRYKNTRGTFTVLSFAKENVRVRYFEDDSVAFLKVSLASKVSIPFESTDCFPVIEKHSSFYQSLGFLCKHGFITASIRHEAKPIFDDAYYNAKGKQPFEGMEGYCVHTKGVNKWGIRIGIIFEAKSFVNIDGCTVVKHDTQKNAIYNQDFGYKLLALGFDLGRNHDVKTILSNVPPQYHKDFQSGYDI